MWFFSNLYEIALGRTPLDLTDDKPTLVQVMAWCRQVTSHYLNQCWHRSMWPYGGTRPQWVNTCTTNSGDWKWKCIFDHQRLVQNLSRTMKKITKITCCTVLRTKIPYNESLQFSRDVNCINKCVGQTIQYMFDEFVLRFDCMYVCAKNAQE